MFTKAVLALALMAPVSAMVAQGEAQVKMGAESVEIADGQTTVLKYPFAKVPFKPYVSECYTPGGVQFLRDSPFDHKHHHALMYAIGINKVSFWEETEKGGKQVHREFTGSKTEPVNGGTWTHFGEMLDWIAPGQDKPWVAEMRTVGMMQLKGIAGRVVSWETQLTPAHGAGDLQLTGNHYYGLGARFIQSMDKNGRFIYASGKPGPIVRGDERNTPDLWCAYQAEADGKPVTIAMFDHPDNPRHPATWFTMGDNGGGFAYLAATLNLDDEPMTLKQDETLRVRYGVVLYDGQPDAKALAKDYKTWKKAVGK